MSGNFLDQLKKLDAEATPGPWDYDNEDGIRSYDIDVVFVCNASVTTPRAVNEKNFELTCLLRNNAKAVIELVEKVSICDATKKLLGVNDTAWAPVSEALSKLKGDV
jgi:hypothetical protein